MTSTASLIAVPPIYETVTWQSKPNISDSDMIQAVTDFGECVRTLPGFLHSALYSHISSHWVLVYYWKTMEDAEHSNQAVADDPRFLQLTALIEPKTVIIQCHSPLAQTGKLAFSVE